MGDDIGSDLSSMAVCFDFRSTNVVQLSNRNPYFYRFRCHHPLITQLSSNNCKNKNKKHLFEPIQVIKEFDLSSDSLFAKLTNPQTESVCGSASKAVLVFK